MKKIQLFPLKISFQDGQSCFGPAAIDAPGYPDCFLRDFAFGLEA